VKRRFVLFFFAAIVAMLVIAACNGDDNGNGNGGATGDTSVEMDEMFFDPDSISAGAGESVTLSFENVGSVLHDFTIDDFNGERVHVEVQPGSSQSITLTMPDSGSWDFYCSVPGHRQAGMEGTLQVN
jgi:uncharacterized cupredoxin-like copper-binding protein